MTHQTKKKLVRELLDTARILRAKAALIDGRLSPARHSRELATLLERAARAVR